MWTAFNQHNIPKLRYLALNLTMSSKQGFKILAHKHIGVTKCKSNHRLILYNFYPGVVTEKIPNLIKNCQLLVKYSKQYLY